MVAKIADSDVDSLVSVYDGHGQCGLVGYEWQWAQNKNLFLVLRIQDRLDEFIFYW